MTNFDQVFVLSAVTIWIEYSNCLALFHQHNLDVTGSLDAAYVHLLITACLAGQFIFN